MARARNIKPAFFMNEVLVGLPFEYRLLFIGLWTLADREGRLEDRPVRIKMEVFPADNVDTDAGLQALNDAGFVLRYEVDGTRYIQILAWKKHQNPHVKEAQSTIPAPVEHRASAHESSISTSAAPDKHQTSPVQTPDKPGASTMQAPEIPERAGLIPDSLIPDSKKPSGAEPPELFDPDGETCDPPADPPAEPTKPARARGCTFSTFVAECRAKGEKPIPEDHPVFRFADDAGIPVEFVRLAWLEFRRDFGDGGKGAKKRQAGMRGWRQHFDNAVRKGWYRLWAFDRQGECYLTPAGVALKREAEARDAA